MNIRAIATAFGLAAALGAGVVAAQQPPTVARLINLEGNVLVSQGDAMVAAINNQRVAVGARVLTTTGAAVVINYDVGCNVSLKENERFTVRVGECPVLAGEIVPVGPAPGAIGGGLGVAGGVNTNTILVIAAIGGIGYIIYDHFKKPSVSPN